MTALIKADIPDNINTIERLHIWSGLALRRLNPALAVLETAEYAQPVVEAVLIRADDGTQRMVVRASIEIEADYAEKTIKFWMNAKDLSQTQLPAAFKTAT